MKNINLTHETIVNYGIFEGGTYKKLKIMKHPVWTWGWLQKAELTMNYNLFLGHHFEGSIKTNNTEQEIAKREAKRHWQKFCSLKRIYNSLMFHIACKRAVEYCDQA